MNIEEKAKTLANYIDRLSDFKIVLPDIPIPYSHMGATITDAILQAGTTWETVVKPRIQKLIKKYPDAKTTSGFFNLLKQININTLLDWNDSDKPNRILKVISLFLEEKIETETDLKSWLNNDLNITKLKKLRGVKNKTADYFKILSGISTSAVDRHLIEFINKAGIDISLNEYSEAREIINKTAEQKGINKSLLDHSIWKYMSEKKGKRKLCKRGHSR